MPLSFDLPLEKLSSYQGRNPKPSDFDSFWDESLAAMHQLDPDIEIVPADFQPPFSRCEHLYFTGSGGARIHAKLLRPRTSSAAGPALVVFHGYGGDSGSWLPHLPYVAAGFTVAALDCRGQGGLSEDTGGVPGNTMRGHIIRGLDGENPSDLLFHKIFLDTAQLARIVMDLPEVDPGKVGAMGASQGGGLTLACAALEPRIRLAAPVYPFLCDYQRVWEMDQAKAAYEELSNYFRLFDPLHKREKKVFERLGYIDVQHLAPRIKAEVLMSTALMDTVCPPSTQFAAYNKIASKKHMRIYPDFTHEPLRWDDDARFQFLMGLL